MNKEKEKLLKKINEVIDLKMDLLLQQFPTIHEIDEGFFVHFFNNWKSSDDNENIKYKKINSVDDENEIVYIMYLPKDSYFGLKKRDCIKNITCLSGGLELNFKNKTRFVDAGEKINVVNEMFKGKSLDNTYLITSNK